MNVKLDENVPVSVANILRSYRHEAHTTHEEGLSGKKDAEVWAAVKSERYFFVILDTEKLSWTNSPSNLSGAAWWSPTNLERA